MTPAMGRLLGSVLGGALSAILFSILLTIKARTGIEWADFLLWVTGIGAPIAILLGARFADRVGRWHPVPLIGWMGVSAVLLGDGLISIAIGLKGLVTIGPVVLLYVPVVFAYGLVYAVYVVPSTLVCAMVWFGTYSMLARLFQSGAGPRLAEC